jgi:hypothetical protein
MHNRIYTLVEKNPIAISRGDDGDLDGDFDGIDWRDLKMVGNGLVDALTSTGLITADDCYLKTSLCRDAINSVVHPAVKLMTSRGISEEFRIRTNAICFKYAQGLIPNSSHSLYFDDSRQIALTADEEHAIDSSVQQTLFTLRARLKHPVMIEDHDKKSIYVVEGKLHSRPSRLVGQTTRREIKGVIENLGYSDFAARIQELDGASINAHYINRNELAPLCELMCKRTLSSFEVLDVIDDTGKRTITARALPPSSI